MQTFKSALVALSFFALSLHANSANASPDPDTTAASTNANTPIFPERKLALFAGAGYLASVGENGSAAIGGVRYAIGKHFALSTDLGWGLISSSSSPVVEDRWWVIPSAAFVLPVGHARFDFGGGAGIGAASGYVGIADFEKQPFTPTWAFQVFPAVRAHAIAAYPLSRDVDMFVRADIASLLFVPSHPGISDSTWLGLSVGAQFRLL